MTKQIFETFHSVAEAEKAATRLLDRGVPLDDIAIAASNGLESNLTGDANIDVIAVDPNIDNSAQFSWWDNALSWFTLPGSDLNRPAGNPEAGDYVWLLVDEKHASRFDDFRKANDTGQIGQDQTNTEQIFHDNPEIDQNPDHRRQEEPLDPESPLEHVMDQNVGPIPPIPPTPNTNVSHP
ncbi:TPA: hypothetical protein ACGO1T_001122 [Streptococcus suis]